MIRATCLSDERDELFGERSARSRSQMETIENIGMGKQHRAAIAEGNLKLGRIFIIDLTRS
jgi:hypothetical protein